MTHHKITGIPDHEWSDEEVALLETMWEGCKPPSHIIRVFAERGVGLTRNAIVGKAKRMGFIKKYPRGKSRGVMWHEARGNRPNVGRRVNVNKSTAIKRVTTSGLVKGTSVTRFIVDDQHGPVERDHYGINRFRDTTTETDAAAPSVSMSEHSESMCSYPMSDDVRALKMCSAPRVAGAYCLRHARMSYRTMPAVKRQRNYNNEQLGYKK